MGNCTSLSIEDALNIVDDYLKASDCDSAATALAQVEENSERALKDQSLQKRIASTYHDLGNLQKQLGRPQNEVDSSFELAKKMGVSNNPLGNHQFQIERYSDDLHRTVYSYQLCAFSRRYKGNYSSLEYSYYDL